MTEPEIYEALNEIFADIFMTDDIVVAPTLSAADVDGWDSFKMIEIIVSVQDRFDIKVHTRDLDNLQNVGDLVRVIREKLA
jgi:acyl carrier protein